MHFTSIFTVALAALASAQLPTGYVPAVSQSLNVRYGNITIKPNQTLSQAVSAVRPVISLNGTQNATYLVALVDLSLPVANARSTTNATLVAGLGSNRTTRLHWLQTGIRQSTNGSFTWNATALAPYGGPMPPAGDIAHTYAFYLYRQPSANFTLRLPADYTDLRAASRVNFNISALSAQVGNGPIAANYFLVQNTTGAAAAPSGNRTNATATSTSSARPGPTNGTAPTVVPARGGAAANTVASGLFALVGVAGAVLLL